MTSSKGQTTHGHITLLLVLGCEWTTEHVQFAPVAEQALFVAVAEMALVTVVAEMALAAAVGEQALIAGRWLDGPGYSDG